MIVEVFFEGQWFPLPAEITSIDQAVIVTAVPLEIPDASWKVFVVPRSFAMREQPESPS